jgi:hypothetical protein
VHVSLVASCADSCVASCFAQQREEGRAAASPFGRREWQVREEALKSALQKKIAEKEGGRARKGKDDEGKGGKKKK